MTDRNGSTTGNRLSESSHNNPPEETERRNSAIDAIINSQKEGISVDQMEEAPKFRTAEDLPSPEEIIDRLGIPDWKILEKKLVRRLDLTLVPMLWILYVTNYLDRFVDITLHFTDITIQSSQPLTTRTEHHSDKPVLAHSIKTWALPATNLAMQSPS